MPTPSYETIDWAALAPGPTFGPERVPSQEECLAAEVKRLQALTTWPRG